MILLNHKGDELCEYELDDTGEKIVSMSDIKSPADFQSIGAWIEYNNQIYDALLLTKKQII